MTVAPDRAPISRVPSIEAPSTTITSSGSGDISAIERRQVESVLDSFIVGTTTANDPTFGDIPKRLRVAIAGRTWIVSRQMSSTNGVQTTVCPHHGIDQCVVTA